MSNERSTVALNYKRTWVTWTAQGSAELDRTLNDVEENGFSILHVLCCDFGVNPRFVVVAVRVELENGRPGKEIPDPVAQAEDAAQADLFKESLGDA